MTDTRNPGIDPGQFREVMGHYPTGVAVVTGISPDGELLAMIVGTFSSVSLEPPLVSFMPMKSSYTFQRLCECESLCINVLGEDQEDTVSAISRRKENKFEGVNWSCSPAGNPVLEGSVAWIDVTIDQIVEGGDHWITLCKVDDLAVMNPVSPLLFFQGGYGGFLSTSLAARTDDQEVSEVVSKVENARGILEGIANGIGCEATLFAAVGRDECVQVLTATGPAVEYGSGLGRRLPLAPPIGDSFVFARSIDEQDRWIHKIRGVSAEQQELLRSRLRAVAEQGYLLSFLPEEESSAYDQVNEATRRYAQGRLTPAEEREVRQVVFQSEVDYAVKSIDENAAYSIGSLVLPVRASDDSHSLTLRLSQFPGPRLGHEVKSWVSSGLSAVQLIECMLKTGA